MAVKQHNEWKRSYRDGAVPVTAQRRYSAHAYRDGEVVCGRVDVIVRADTRQRIVGWVQPPQQRHGNLHEIEFDLHEPS